MPLVKDKASIRWRVVLWIVSTAVPMFLVWNQIIGNLGVLHDLAINGILTFDALFLVVVTLGFGSGRDAFSKFAESDVYLFVTFTILSAGGALLSLLWLVPAPFGGYETVIGLWPGNGFSPFVAMFFILWALSAYLLLFVDGIVRRRMATKGA